MAGKHIVTNKQAKYISAQVAKEKSATTNKLPKELEGIVIDTSRLKNKDSSTKILKDLRYSTK